MSWASIALGQSTGGTGQPQVDLSRLYTGQMGSIDPNAPPIFRASDWRFNQANGFRDESGALIGNENPYWSTNFGGAGSGNWDFQTNPDGSLGIRFKTGAGSGMRYGYQQVQGPDGEMYMVPAGAGVAEQMDSTKYGQDVWMPAAFMAAGAAGIAGAGAGGAGAGTAAGAGGAAEAIPISLAGGGTTTSTLAPLAGYGGAAGAAGAAGAGGAAGGSGAAGGGALSGLGSMFSNGSWIPAAGAVIGAIGANRAADQQADAANRATDLQRDIYTQNRADLAPWRQAGGSALSRLSYLLGIGDQNAAGGAGGGEYGSLMRDFGESDFRADPGYAFRVREGEAAINRNALARGRYNSGSVLKALQGYNSDLASQEYGNAFNRFQAQRGTRLNALQALSGTGQSAAGQTAQLGAQFGAQAGQNMIGAGNAQAAGTVGMANAINNGLGQWWNYQQSQDMINALRGSNGG